MENASKALLMAGSILIAILIISLLVKSYSSVRTLQKTTLSEKEQEEIITFNEQYTKYLNQYVYGTEVITVINKTLDSNNYPVTTKIKFANDGDGYSYNGYTYNKETKKYEKNNVKIKKGTNLTISTDEENDSSTVNSFINSMSESDGISTMAFKCTSITYDDSTGRVNSITFEEKQWGDLY